MIHPHTHTHADGRGAVSDRCSARGVHRALGGLLALLICAVGCTASDSTPTPNAETGHTDMSDNRQSTPPEPTDASSIGDRKARVTDGHDSSAQPSVTVDSPASSSVNVHGVPDDLLKRMVASVAEQAGVSADTVQLVRAESTTWRDGSLGCPQPGMAYSQALVDGYWVIYRAGDEEYDLRATRQGTFTRCTGATKQPPIRYDDT